VNYPNEWANNLNSFLTIANNHGMRVTFQEMGTQWQTLFGIVPPEPAKGIVGTSIAAKISCLGSNTTKVGSFFIELFCLDRLWLESKCSRVHPMSQIKITKGIVRNAATLFRRSIKCLKLQVAYNIS